MSRPTRRDFLVRTTLLAASVPLARTASAAAAQAQPAPAGSAAPAAGPVPARKFTLNLMPGMIGLGGVKTQAELNAIAARHGFESVEPRGAEIARMSADDLKRLADDMTAKNLGWGAAGLPNGARADSATFADEVKGVPALAAALKRAGVTRISTWISPSSTTLPYLANFRQHVSRYTEVARVLDGEGLRFGLEYIGTPSLHRRPRHAFVHSMAEARELLAEIPTKNVGFVLDSWHWFTAAEGEAELLSVTAKDVVAVDLNDAQRGVPLEHLSDNQRELPATTNVIDAGLFLRALARIGYDGPVRAEPFNAALNAMDDDAACAATIAALRRALDKIQS
jgi:sugar phosphate isomerase/epimerase